MVVSRLPKILIIEGDQAKREEYRAGLSGLGEARILFAADLRSGLVALKKTPFDVLLVSGELAGRKDCALLRAMKRDAVLNRLAVVALVDDCQSGTALAVMEAGANVCLTPPYSQEHMLAVVLEALSRTGTPAPASLLSLSETPPDAAHLASDGPFDNFSGDTGSIAAERSAAEDDGGHTSGPGGAASVPKALVHDEEDANRLFSVGRQLLAAGEFAGAIKAFSGALRRNGRLVGAFQGLADACTGLGRHEKAEHFRQRAADLAADIQVEHGGGGEPDGQRLGHEKNDAAPVSGGVPSGRLPQAAEADGAAGATGPVEGKEGAEGADPQEHAADGGVVVQKEQAGRDSWSEKRRHTRVPLADYGVTVGASAVPLSVVDVSIGGICFKHDGRFFEHGQIVRFDLINQEEIKVGKISAAVRHVDEERVGCQFLELSERQHEALDAIIVAEQAKLDEVVGDDDNLTRRDSSGKIIVDLGMW